MTSRYLENIIKLSNCDKQRFDYNYWRAQKDVLVKTKKFEEKVTLNC